VTIKQFLRKMAEKTTMAKPFSLEPSQELATFGAGCFWGVEKSFRRKFVGNGALDVQVGYAGGHQDNVSYRQVCSGSTGHAEVVQIKYVSVTYLCSQN
jgi:peptide-methionine (S)-S-oxide reductase